MMGINLEKIEHLIKIDSKLLSEAKNVLDDINSINNDLSDSYNGYSLNSIYSITKKQNSNLTNIYDVLTSYLLLFNEVKNTYIKQDILFGDQIGNVIKKFNTN